MTLLWQIWEICINFLECFFFSYLLSKQLSYTQKTRIRVYIGLIVMIECETALNFLPLPLLATTLTMFLLHILYALLCFSGLPATRVLWGISGSLVTQATNLILSNLLPLFSGLNIVDTLSPSSARFGVQVFYILIVITLFWLLSHIPQKRHLMLPIRLQLIVFIIIGLGIYAVGYIVGYALGINRTAEERQTLVTVSFSILVMLIAIILLFDKMGRTICEKARIEKQLQISALEEESIKRAKEMISVWKHDMNNQLEILRYYADNHDVEHLKKSLGEMEQNFERITDIQSTGSSMIDACISSKLIVAHAKQIPFTMNISRISDCAIRESDLCTMLGNLLTNAIEACEKIQNPDERYIDLSIFQVRDMVHIDILNSSEGKYSMKNKKLLTSKSEPNHGWGLANVERTLKKHNAFFQINPDTDYFQIRLFIPAYTIFKGATAK